MSLSHQLGGGRVQRCPRGGIVPHCSAGHGCAEGEDGEGEGVGVEGREEEAQTPGGRSQGDVYSSRIIISNSLNNCVTRKGA